MGTLRVAPGEVVSASEWFERYVRLSYARGWVHDNGEWLIAYGTSLIGSHLARRIVSTIRKESLT